MLNTITNQVTHFIIIFKKSLGYYDEHEYESILSLFNLHYE